MTESNFKFKGSTIPVVVLELTRYSASEFSTLLTAQIEQAPQFFNQAPVLIDLSKLDDSVLDVAGLVTSCRELGLQPVAFKGIPKALIGLARATGLATLSDASTPVRARELPATTNPPAQSKESSTDRESSTNNEPSTDNEPQVVIKTVEKIVHRAAKVISKPVRSGQQIYAEGTDLVVLSNVSEGAEVLADGNIHIYGALRGRALAGVMGDLSARIFCKNMDAELISVAGNFLPSHAIDDSVRNQAVQIFLSDDSLKLEPL